MTFEEMKDRMIEHDDFTDKHKYNNWSCFQAGRIIQFIRDNNDKDVVEFGVSKNQDINEICLIVSHYTERNIRIEPREYGFYIILEKAKCRSDS